MGSMTEESLSKQMQTRRKPGEPDPETAGPFVAISREYGCGGFSLGLLLLDLLNEDIIEGQSWQIYHKEILENLASDTGLAMDLLEQRRREKPRLLSEFFRTISGKKDRVPSGMEIRNRMTQIIREIATEGNAVLVGQGSAAATSDLPNGLSVRLEAPLDWRIKQIAFREGLTETQARIHINEEMERRMYLQKIYERKYPRKPAWHLTFDCSLFSLSQIAVLVHRALRLRKIISK
jgi:cytidylate kinase